MCHFLIRCRVRDGNSLLLNGFSEIIHRLCALERSEEEIEACFFSKLAFEIDNLEWREPQCHHHWLDIRKSRVHRFHSARKKETELILNRKEKRCLMKAREINCLNSLMKKRQREWVCEIMCKPKNNVSIMLIVLFYPDVFLLSLKPCFRGNTVLRPASMR